MKEFLEKIKHHSFLVTGGAGFIGSNLVYKLLAEGADKVVVLDNFSTGKWENLKNFRDDKRLSIIEGDIRDFNTCMKCMKGIDFVSHQAALGSVPRSIDDPLTTNDVNIGGFLNILLASKNSEIKKLVYAASSSTYGDSEALPKTENIIGKPLSPYAITKYVNELYAENFSSLFGLSSIGLRYFNVFGPNQDPNGAYAAVIPLFFKSILSHEPAFINGDGFQTRDFTFVQNAVSANIAAMFSEISTHDVFNIACGTNISLNELWSLICQIAETQIDPVYRPTRIGDVKGSLADISKATRLLGYKANYQLEEGLKLTYKWYKENG